MNLLGNTPEYSQTNKLIIGLMEDIDKHPIFDNIAPMGASEIVNLSLEILRDFIIIHSHDGEDSNYIDGVRKRLIEMVNSSLDFTLYSRAIIGLHDAYNEEINDILSLIELYRGNTNELIHKIIVENKRLEGD